MQDSSKASAGATRATASFDRISRLPEDWRLARAARVNMLLIHTDDIFQDVLELILLDDFQEPVATWRPGEPLLLPPVGRTKTMILHNVGALTPADQRRLLEWSERAAGRTQVVSTTPTPLMPRVTAGAFIDALYYRLNTVCVDVTAQS
jgi:hypothetical protein